jgi:RNA polymerase sigma-70 factor (ECF subfamily)
MLSPVDAVAAEEDRRRLWEQAAEVLTETQLSALWLYYVEQTPIKDIARVLGRSRVAVKTVLFRARKKLLPLLDETEDPSIGGCRPSAKKTCGCSTAAEASNG